MEYFAVAKTRKPNLLEDWYLYRNTKMHHEIKLWRDMMKEANEKVRDIIDNTDLLDNADAEYSTAIKVIESDDDCDDDDDDMCDDECEDCIYKDEDECLLDEFY